MAFCYLSQSESMTPAMRCNWTKKNLCISDTLSAYTSGMEKAKWIKNLLALSSPLENLVMGVIPGITSTGGGDSSGVPSSAALGAAGGNLWGCRDTQTREPTPTWIEDFSIG